MLTLVIFVIQLILLYFLSRKTTQYLGQLFYRLTKSRDKATYLMAIFYLPGTFVHEIAHFLTAMVLLVPVGQPELMPKLEGDLVKLGSVPIGKTDLFRKAMVGIAPVVFGLGIIFALLSYSNSINILNKFVTYLLLGYLIFSLVNTMFSSKRDLEGVWILAVVSILVIAALYALGIRISVDLGSPFLVRLLDLVKKGSLFLLVPIVFDLVVIYLLRLVKK